MAKLEIFLLGTPQIYVDGVEVTAFNTRKDRALLAYLAVTGTLHSRETLAGLLWSELPEASARRNLRHTLSHLQKVIGPPWLTVARGVALTKEHPWSVDVQTLRTTVESLISGQSVATSGNDPETIERLNRVLDLYRGEFLQGFYLQHAEHFEEWVLAQREASRLLALQGLEALVERCLLQGAYGVGLTATRRLLQLEPWSEPAHCLQMQLLAQSGRRADALAQYERCRQVLAAELRIEPLPTTTALYHQIQTGHYTWLGARRPAAVVVASSPEPQLGREAGAIRPVTPNNLLTPLAEFIGRQTELDFIQQRLGTSDCRLLTIVGPGGMGKTSLAHAAAQAILHTQSTTFPNGIYFVALAGLDLDKHQAAGGWLVTTIAKCIGCELTAGLSPQVQLQHYLRQRRLLLILDNFEHVLAATATVLALLTQAPALTVLITSRTRLNVRGETVLTLAKLSLPSPTTLVTQPQGWPTSEAVAMFVQRAQFLDPNFTLNATNLEAVLSICRLVDGLPLGIELATSMLPMLSCAELAQKLRQSLDFLEADMHDLPVEQRTLRAVFERSWGLLALPEQTLLAKVAIFPATFHWAAAQVIAEATLPVLTRLIDQSLVTTTPDGRYTLHPSVHAFALEKLAQTPVQGEALRRRYAHFYLDFLAQKEWDLKGAASAVVTAQIYLELDHLRLAWRLAINDWLPTALLPSLHLFFFIFELQGLLAEGVEWAESSLQHCVARREAPGQADAPQLDLLIGSLQIYVGWFSGRLGRMPQAYAAFEASFTHLSSAANPFAIVLCLALWAGILRGSDIQQAKVLLSEAVRQVGAIDDGWLNNLVYLLLGETNQLLGNYREAMAQYTQAYVVAQQTNLPWSLANSQHLLGRLHI
ncbi:MAG: BTAD domain-containing putative transcriptional regulator, partial [Chloroflexi bacterium]|nr:BTAD domain-containing putative transcriptional regulator [Chloroflexota bacterium]